MNWSHIFRNRQAKNETCSNRLGNLIRKTNRPIHGPTVSHPDQAPLTERVALGCPEAGKHGMELVNQFTAPPFGNFGNIRRQVDISTYPIHLLD